jgi:ribosomal protein L11 methyltransferase
MSEIDNTLYVIRFVTNKQRAGLLEDVFELMGIDMVSWHEEEKDKVIFEAFFESHEDAIASKERLQKVVSETPDDQPLTLDIAELANKDWSEEWKKHFHVVRVSDRVVIKPTWETFVPEPDDCVIEIDPGLSFGSGHHFTTQSCLKLIDQVNMDSPGLSFCDLGCGSGILSIGAAKLGFTDITAMDNNPSSIDVAHENFELNGVGHKIKSSVSDLEEFEPGETFRVVAANILADVLIKFASQIASMVALEENSYLILAGILEEQYDEIKDIYTALGFKEIHSLVSAEWKSGLFKRS